MSHHVFSALAVAWSVALSIVVAWAALRSRRRPAARGGPALDAILVRPCAGLEPSLARALGSTARVAPGPPSVVRFAVASAQDAAAPTAFLVAEELRRDGVDVEVVVTGAVGPNRKADQIGRTLARPGRRSPFVIVADSDVDLEGLSLPALLAPFSDPRVAAVWAVPVEVAPLTLADRASAAVLDTSLHAFPLLAALDPAGMVGKLCALRTDALEQVGGFGALVSHLGEDMELARRLHAAAWRTAVAPVVAPSLAQGRTWAEAIRRYARWIQVIRAQRAHLLPTYPALLFATPLVVLLSALGAWLEGPQALLAAGIALTARILAGALARSRCCRPLRLGSLATDAVLADVLLFLAFVRAMTSRRTNWRGVELCPDPRTGRLTGEVS